MHLPPIVAAPLVTLSILVLSILMASCEADPPDACPRCAHSGSAAVFEQALRWTQQAEGQRAQDSKPPAFRVAHRREVGCAFDAAWNWLHRGRHRHGGHFARLEQCNQDGQLAGQVAADLYCDLSIALGGLGTDDLLSPGPSSSCSRAFESRCRNMFDLSAKSRADCAPFIRGQFRAAYEVARFNQCLFSLDEAADPEMEMERAEAGVNR